MTNESYPKHCPLCGQANNCKVNQETPCWCHNVKVPSALLERIPAEHRRKACVCFKCIQTFKDEQKFDMEIK